MLRADVAERRCCRRRQKEKVRSRRRRGKSVGSVGETLGATLGETLATPDAHRAVDDAVDALVDAEAAGAEDARNKRTAAVAVPGISGHVLSAARRARGSPPGAADQLRGRRRRRTPRRQNPVLRCARAKRTRRDAAHYAQECRIHESRARLSGGGSDVVFAAGLRHARSLGLPLGGQPSSLGLPGGSSFVRDAEAHLAIEVKRSWFGLRDDEDLNASPARGVRTTRGGPRQRPGERRLAAKRAIRTFSARVGSDESPKKRTATPLHLNTTVHDPQRSRVSWLRRRAPQRCAAATVAPRCGTGGRTAKLGRVSLRVIG